MVLKIWYQANTDNIWNLKKTSGEKGLTKFYTKISVIRLYERCYLKILKTSKILIFFLFKFVFKSP